MNNWRESARERLTSGCRLPHLPRVVGTRAQGHHAFDLTAHEQRIEPAISVTDQGGIFLCLGLYRAIHAIKKCVHDTVALSDPELGKKTLQAPASFPNQDAPDNGFVLGGILPDYDHTR
jgi:hypothetical protein